VDDDDDDGISEMTMHNFLTLSRAPLHRETQDGEYDAHYSDEVGKVGTATT
jgi:hypothetical protein